MGLSLSSSVVDNFEKKGLHINMGFGAGGK